MERLHKFLARCGVGSRRYCEKLIGQQKILVNGELAELGMRIDPEHDRVTVDGRLITRPEERFYLLLYKPKGYVSTLKDPKAGPDLRGLIKDIPGRIYPAGRLDQESEDLLFMSNDGELTNRLIHPRFKIPKTYRVRFKGNMPDETIQCLRRGVSLEDGPTQQARIRLIERKDGNTLLEMTIFEGRKRQIRRMGEAVGHPVLELIRIKFGPFELGDLRPGEYRILEREEVENL